MHLTEDAELLVERFVSAIPAISRTWDSYVASSGGGEIECVDMAAIARFVVEEAAAGRVDSLEIGLGLAETVLESGNQHDQDIVATCFLESVVHAVSREEIPAEVVVPLLGGRSREYWRAWDSFTGVHTRGL